MNKRQTALLLSVMGLAGGCRDWLDVNTNPNGPQSVSANLYLPPMLHWMVTSPQFDGRFTGRYAQEWTLPLVQGTTTPTTWDRMGYDPGSDNGAQQWRDVYWSLGQNLIDMNAKATAEQRWDLLGVGLILKAWGWQVLTDLHGEIIIKEAFDESRTTFDYDTQDYAYQEVRRLLDSAIVLLQRTDGAVDQTYLAVGDHIYGGNRLKWLRFAHGLKALVLNHFSNKPGLYQPDSVIAEVDLSFTGNVDDPLLAYPATSTDFQDYNFWGRSRNNITSYRQTQFIVNLMNGTQFGGGSDPNAVDPRMSRMLSPAPDGQYRGLNPNNGGFASLPAAQQPNNFFGYATSGGLGLPARYIFADKSKLPVMTYAELQFIKAEAALKKGDQATARTAYINGISSSIDFVNARNLDAGQTPSQITGTEKTTFLADTNIVPAVGNLTLSHVMSQKFIALWGWGHNEIWMDLRRYHYTDSVGGVQVFRGFTKPTLLYPDNGPDPVQRIRPRYNSEYVWNQAGLSAIGALASNYHTKLMWITEP
jgi:SusD/RagB-like outer membrane lipoprotein